MNIFALILLNIAFFICNIYPKHILEYNGSLHSIFGILINLLFYIALGFILFQAFHNNGDIFSNGVFSPFQKGNRKRELTRILLIPTVQTALDLISLSLKPLLQENTFYANDLLTIVGWVIFYVICTKKETSIFRIRKFLLLIIPLVLLLAGTSIGNYCLLDRFFATIDRYYVTAPQTMQTIQNIEFLYGFKNFILDTLCGSILLAAHYLMNRSVTKKKKDFRNIVVQGVTFFVRGLVILAVVWGSVAVKYWVFPYSCLKDTDMYISEQYCYEKPAPYDYRKSVDKTITRIDQGGLRSVYKITKHKIYDQGSLVLQYNTMGESRLSERLTVDDVNFFLLHNTAISFEWNGEVIVVHSEDEMKISNDSLTQLYKHLIKENYWNFFVQGSKYLLQHDREFIEPYLARFACGEFKFEELKTLDEMSMNKEYIQNVSKELNDY